jgi:hypothetical protein
MNLRIIFFIFFLIVGKSYCQNNKEIKIEISVKNYLDRINQNMTLTKLEKEKLFTFKKNHLQKLSFVENKYKNHAKLSDEMLKINIGYKKSIVIEFGKKRGLQILEASKVLKGSYFV